MFSLESINKMNSKAAVAKEQFRARSLNTGVHPKKAAPKLRKAVKPDRFSPDYVAEPTWWRGSVPV